jgi:hypothetical protein
MHNNHTGLFKSFWMGGFECTDQINSSGNRVDFINVTRHLSLIDADYKQLAQFGIKTVREGIRWSFVERSPYEYDFSTVKTMLNAGKANGVQQIWDICHFGFPSDLSPLHPHFTNRFVALCSAFVKFHRKECPDETLIVTPINEVSFISWLGGEAGGAFPFCIGNGWHVKYALMKAYIQGIRAMKAIDPYVRILTTEPVVNIVPPLYATEAEIEEAALAHAQQFQSLDMLSGSICPELGGSPDLLDLLGFNFYYNNQWVLGFNEFLPWLNDFEDPRWRPLSELLADAYHRYNKPILLTETSHSGEDRPLWINFIGEHCKTVLDQGIPLLGICLYPIIDRPDWDNLDQWHQSGLWDEVFNADGSSKRVLNSDYGAALLNTQQLLARHPPSITIKETCKYAVVSQSSPIGMAL